MKKKTKMLINSFSISCNYVMINILIPCRCMIYYALIMHSLENNIIIIITKLNCQKGYTLYLSLLIAIY